MSELLNICFSYLCRTTRQNEDGKSPTVLRITFRSQRRNVFTGLYCFKDDWDNENTKVKKADKEADSLNKNLLVIHQKTKHISFNALDCYKKFDIATTIQNGASSTDIASANRNISG